MFAGLLEAVEENIYVFSVDVPHGGQKNITSGFRTSEIGITHASLYRRTDSGALPC